MAPQTETTSDQESLGYDLEIELQYIIKPSKFFMLHVLSMGLYSTWWLYKVWRFFIQKEGSNGNAAIRVVFSIIYLIPLMYRILQFAKEKGYTRHYYPVLLYVLFFLSVICGMLPPPLFLLTLFSGLFLLPMLSAFNYAISKSPEIPFNDDTSLSVWEIIIIVFGGILWALILLGLLFMGVSQ